MFRLLTTVVLLIFILYNFLVSRYLKLEKSERLKVSGQEDRFLLVVFGWRRYESLKRLLVSLKNANYHGQQNIDIMVFVDANPLPEVLEYLHTFKWLHGNFQLKMRNVKLGLEKNIMLSWYPESEHEYAVFLEDDIEVSQHFFTFVLKVLEQYKKEKKLNTPESEKTIGIGLSTPPVNEIIVNGDFDPHSFSIQTYDFFLMCLPSSWGAVYFPTYWREFIDYYNIRSDDLKLEAYPVPWTKSNKWNKSWKKYFIEFMHLSGYVFLYPNFPDKMSFSTHHKEKGVHSRNKKPFYSIEEQRNIKKSTNINYTKPLIQNYTTEGDNIISDGFGNMPVIGLAHETLPTIHSLVQWGFLSSEIYTEKTHTKRQIEKGTCVLDHICPNRRAEKTDGDKYVHVALFGSFYEQLFDFSLLIHIGSLLHRKIVVEDMFFTLNNQDKLTMHEIFELDGEHLWFLNQLSVTVENKIVLVNSEEEMLPLLEGGDGLPVPFIYKEQDDIIDYYITCEDTIISFSSFDKMRSSVKMPNFPPIKKYRNLVEKILVTLGTDFGILVENKNLEEREHRGNTTIYLMGVTKESPNESIHFADSIYTQDFILQTAEELGISQHEKHHFVPIVELAIRRTGRII